jgi:AmmeMemoRadiSam system protein A
MKLDAMQKPEPPPGGLDPDQGRALVKLARLSLMERFGRRIPDFGFESLNATLAGEVFQRPCGTFVTLKLEGRLRGCIGTLSPSEPLAAGIRRNALNAAFHDPRFAPLSEAEFNRVAIEISVLTVPGRLEHGGGADLASRLTPHADGVVIRKGHASATFLPQVWEQLPRPEDFLTQLCLKAGLPRGAWKTEALEVSTYRVQHFE